MKRLLKKIFPPELSYLLDYLKTIDWRALGAELLNVYDSLLIVDAKSIDTEKLTKKELELFLLGLNPSYWLQEWKRNEKQRALKRFRDIIYQHSTSSMQNDVKELIASKIDELIDIEVKPIYTPYFGVEVNNQIMMPFHHRCNSHDNREMMQFHTLDEGGLCNIQEPTIKECEITGLSLEIAIKQGSYLSAKDGTGTAFDMKDLAKAHGYASLDAFRQSDEYKAYADKAQTLVPTKQGANFEQPISELGLTRQIEKKQNPTGVWKEFAGINGALLEPTDVFLYGGGSLDDAVEGNTPILFRANGSGHVANKNISWDELGNMLIRGTFESNKDGNRIIIDPNTRSIQMISKAGKIVLNASFYEYEGSETGSDIYSYTYDANGNIIGAMRIMGGRVMLYKGDPEDHPANYIMDIAAHEGKIAWYINKEAMPKGRDNVYNNQVYLDGDTLKVR